MRSNSRAAINHVHYQALARFDDAPGAQFVPAEQIGQAYAESICDARERVARSNDVRDGLRNAAYIGGREASCAWNRQHLADRQRAAARNAVHIGDPIHRRAMRASDAPERFAATNDMTIRRAALWARRLLCTHGRGCE